MSIEPEKNTFQNVRLPKSVGRCSTLWSGHC